MKTNAVNEKLTSQIVCANTASDSNDINNTISTCIVVDNNDNNSHHNDDVENIDELDQQKWK